MTEIIRDRVVGVNIYPLKSAHAATVNGKPPTALPVGKTGFEVNGVRDRDFVLYDPNDNCFVSQRGWDLSERQRHRGDRRLATVRMDILDDHVAVVSTAGHLELPNQTAKGNRRKIEIFGKKLPVVEQDPGASRYFSKLLEREVQLLRSDREEPRILAEHNRREGAFNQVAGSDGYPFLLVSEASLAAAHENNGKPQGLVPIDRFRGSIVIAGDQLGAFGEDYLDPQAKFYVGEIGAWAIKPCARCPIPNNDQETGDLVGGGISILKDRFGRSFTGSEGKYFGENLVHANVGVIAVNDLVVIEALSETPQIEFYGAA